ncbi:hypothetical protein YDYSY3_26680 [Paenibacillus chitinolyticus]|nr:hypothetical protein YDYSY3_26680 [Paenibacillus chitinolyticus]
MRLFLMSPYVKFNGTGIALICDFVAVLRRKNILAGKADLSLNIDDGDLMRFGIKEVSA